MAIEYFLCYHSYARKLAKLSDQEVGRLFRALLQYSETGETQELTGRESVAFDFIADDIDRAKANYENQCKQNSENGRKGGRPRKPPLSKKAVVFEKSEKSQNKYENENEDKDEDERKEAYASCPEPEIVSGPPVICLPLNDGTEYAVSEEQCQEWAGLYPAVDVIQQLRNMRGWLIANPGKKKTRRGILRFVIGWLAREQDRGRTISVQPSPAQSSGNVFLDLLRKEEERGQN